MIQESMNKRLSVFLLASVPIDRFMNGSKVKESRRDVEKQAVFQEVAQQIAQRVHEGTYVTSQKLPSDYDLAEEFQCSRLTVRKAIDLLIGQNLLVKEKGKGTYVMKQPRSKAALAAPKFYRDRQN